MDFDYLENISSRVRVINNQIDEIIDIDEEIDISNINSIESEDIIKKIERKMLNYAKEL